MESSPPRNNEKYLEKSFDIDTQKTATTTTAKTLLDEKDEICAICRENECDFKTRCRHYFHLDCLEAACKCTNEPKCPYCTKIISLNSDIEIILQNPLKICEEVLSLNLSTECIYGIFNYAIEKLLWMY